MDQLFYPTIPLSVRARIFVELPFTALHHAMQADMTAVSAAIKTTVVTKGGGIRWENHPEFLEAFINLVAKNRRLNGICMKSGRISSDNCGRVDEAGWLREGRWNTIYDFRGYSV